MDGVHRIAEGLCNYRWGRIFVKQAGRQAAGREAGTEAGTKGRREAGR